GLGLVPGRVTRLAAARVPHMGWNAIEEPSDPLFAKAPLREAYYANSFVCRPLDPAVVTAWSRHEDDRFAAAVRVGRAVGVQFHPEKSSAAGVAWLAAWLAEVRR
ncbi:MAG: glutamine amidotransferase-related protein, partial [bacterium]